MRTKSFNQASCQVGCIINRAYENRDRNEKRATAITDKALRILAHYAANFAAVEQPGSDGVKPGTLALPREEYTKIRILLYPKYELITLHEFLTDHTLPEGYAFTASGSNGFSYDWSDPVADSETFKRQVAELAKRAKDLPYGIYLNGAARIRNYEGEKVIRVDVFVAKTITASITPDCHGKRNVLRQID